MSFIRSSGAFADINIASTVSVNPSCTLSSLLLEPLGSLWESDSSVEATKVLLCGVKIGEDQMDERSNTYKSSICIGSSDEGER